MLVFDDLFVHHPDGDMLVYDGELVAHHPNGDGEFVHHLAGDTMLAFDGELGLHISDCDM